MNPLTYLGFTIFSVIMQFCVMEFIQERFQLDKDSTSFNESEQEDFAVLKKLTRKPHALFYRTDAKRMSFQTNHNTKSTKYSNASLNDMILLTSTDITDTNTILEVFYDENTTVTDDFFTTESYSLEFDNVTEITLLDKSGTATTKPSTGKTVAVSKKCLCNLLYKMCDINCCCDTDCTDEERRLFTNCDGEGCGTPKKGIYFCNSHLTCRKADSTVLFNDLFCVVKVNVPDKRIKSHYQLDTAAINASFKWNSIEKPDLSFHNFKKKYEYGDPLWLRRNGSMVHMYVPVTIVNSYCSGKTQIKFLIDESIKCNVKLGDLRVLSVVKEVKNTELVSVTEFCINKTVSNCSTLYCANWTILACDDTTCSDFNVTVHSPTCTELYCNNLPVAVDYTFYYFESKISNATLKLYLSTIPSHINLMNQEINVKWYFGNESIKDIIHLSGNPGYIPGLPVILSSFTNNHTKNFYNRTNKINFLSLPKNVNGECVWLKSKKSLQFDVNTRTKCRLNIKQDISNKNATSTCRAIQTNIKEYLTLNRTLFVSPYGNPRDIGDDSWIPLEVYDSKLLYGEYHTKYSKLICYNLVTRFAFVIAYADMSVEENSQENKIVKAVVHLTEHNITLDTTEPSTVLTIDTRFVDISRPVGEFAGAPQLNIQLPTNFFIDYPSNNCYIFVYNIVLVILTCLVPLLIK